MNGFFLAVDLLGFGNIIRNSDDSQLSIRIDEWIDLVKKAAAHGAVSKISLISDTVFAATESSTEGLHGLIEMSRYLLSKGVRASLPVRGGITHGQYTWGEFTYGKAVIESHSLEMNQNWIGITCSNNLPYVDQFWGIDSLICYPPPMKKGLIGTSPVVAWDVPQFDDLTKYLCQKGLTAPNEFLQWPWAEKVSNTVQFGVYRRMVKKDQLDCKHFRGFLPIQAIEMNIK